MKPHRLRPWSIAVALWLGLTSAGCDMFRPAEPEPPRGQPILADYSDPDRTLDMIALAIADKALTNGSSVYIGAFAESLSSNTPAYHQFFSPDDIAIWQSQTGGTPPADWSTGLELDFYSKFVNLRGDEYLMVWEPDVTHPDDIREVQATIHRHYDVSTQNVDGEATGHLARGYADLVLVKGVDGRWRITIWNDRIDPDADPGAEEVSLGRRRLGTRQ